MSYREKQGEEYKVEIYRDAEELIFDMKTWWRLKTNHFENQS